MSKKEKPLHFCQEYRRKRTGVMRLPPRGGKKAPNRWGKQSRLPSPHLH